MRKEALAALCNKLPEGKVECVACARRCKIPEGSHGFCFVRQNEKGKLYLANYGMLEAMQIDPIEKKPFNHFMPGTYSFGIGTSSCNWGCLFCQNHNISKERDISGSEVTPEEVVDLAIRNGTQSIAYTYNEPAIFVEYALDVARIAHKKGLENVFVTNGYLTEEIILEMSGLIDAAVVNFKGNGEQKFANKYEAVVSNEPIKEAMRIMKEKGMHLEMTDLIIPRVGDSLEACDMLTKWVCRALGPDTPMQFTRFHPDYKMLDHPSTSYETLVEHYRMAKRNGIRYAYVGNVPGNPYESTYCPECNALAVERYGFSITRWLLDGGMRCKSCGNKIFMTGSRPEELEYRGIYSLY